MTRCPKIGARVSYRKGTVVGPCIGVVTTIYPTYEYDEVNDRPTNVPRPEREWHVVVRVESIPTPWCYPGTDVFAPPVSMLTYCRKENKGNGKPIIQSNTGNEWVSEMGKHSR